MNQARPSQASKRSESKTQGYFVPVTSVHKVEADGVRVFYRAAGDPNSPVVLLLHGFPASSFMFRELIPRLADDYRVIAPDLPGFGFTEVPEERQYIYSFDRLAATLNAFTQALKIRRFALYVFDYGAPTGFRLAMAHPDRVTAIVTQNGNAYEEGLADAWGPIRKYWAEPTSENREVLRTNILTLEGTRWQYTHGVSDPETRSARILHAGRGSAGASGQQRHPARFVSRLRLEREALSGVSRLFPEGEAASAGDLGQERPILPSRRGRGISKRHSERTGRVPGYGTFRA